MVSCMTRTLVLMLAATMLSTCAKNGSSATAPTQTGPSISFFVTSAKSTTGNIGGLRGADTLCQSLATAVGAGSKRWRAYLSVERDPDTGARTDARSRIGNGPWFNANGALIANNLTEIHARTGDVELFVDERGQRING